MTEPPSASPLQHLQTLTSPTGITRAWSSRPHPSPRTPLLATASSDKSIQVWDLRDFKLVSTITGGHKRSIRSVGWKDWGPPPKTTTEVGGSGRPEKPVTLASGSFDANVGVWVWHPEENKKFRSQPHTLQQRRGQEGDDDYDPIGDGGDEIDMTHDDNKEEEEEDWQFTTLLTGPDSEIKDLQFSPPHYSANFLAMCSRDKSVWVWEEVDEDNEWETIAVLGDHTGDVKCVAWCAGSTVTLPSGNDDGQEEEVVIGSREVLASGSYDDTIRLWRDVEEEGDWVCVAVITGHKGTVWDVNWEGHLNREFLQEGVEIREWEPRIMSVSDDKTVRVWRRELTPTELEKKKARIQSGVGEKKMDRLPSSIRPQSVMEKWYQESTLPEVHVRSIYAVDWSRRTGLVVTCGGDGTIAVYKEILDSSVHSNNEDEGQQESKDIVMNGTDEQISSGTTNISPTDGEISDYRKTKWIVLAIIEAGHDEYEINHVCWALRRDKDKRWDGEEVIVSTGDDGDVRVWTLPDSVVRDLKGSL